MSYTKQVKQAENINELFTLWAKYLGKVGKHPNCFQEDVTKQDWKDRDLDNIKEAILHTVKNGWRSLVFPERKETKEEGRTHKPLQKNGDLSALEHMQRTLPTSEEMKRG